MVFQTLKAAELLEKNGISARVVNVGKIKPMDKQAIKQYADGMPFVMTVEEHSIIGGLRSAICEVLSESGIPVKILGINDSFGTSAESYETILGAYGLMPADIAAAAENMIRNIRRSK